MTAGSPPPKGLGALLQGLLAVEPDIAQKMRSAGQFTQRPSLPAPHSPEQHRAERCAQGG